MCAQEPQEVPLEEAAQRGSCCGSSGGCGCCSGGRADGDGAAGRQPREATRGVAAQEGAWQQEGGCEERLGW